MRKLFITTAVALAVLPAGTALARPTLTQEAAQSKAQAYAEQVMQDENAATRDLEPLTEHDRALLEADGFDPADYAPEIIESVDVECDLETKYRAVCGIDRHMEGGDTQELEIDIVISRHGKLLVR